ncbi:MAG: tRNA preQ1(34) S-adenosylmethionine ribosyltransferase-isomerase QueA [Rikenellaceae bacterium]
MKLSNYKYEFNLDMLAKYPADQRDESRLMVYDRRTKKVEHKIFKDLLTYFKDGDTMLFNNTKVFPAQLYGNKEKTGAEIEVFLLRELNADMRLWDVIVEPARKIRIGNKLYFGPDDAMVAEVIDNTTSRGRTLRFLFDGSYEEFRKELHNLGQIPIPRWIRPTPEPIDEERYQTIYAKEEGAVAAPTAGLHFSKHLLKRLEIKGINIGELTLHVGLGSFRSVDVEDLTKHKMDSEKVIIPEATAKLVNDTKARGSKVCAIGTTVIRAVESSVSASSELKPFDGWTNKFIFPPYEFSIPDALVTNFHLPYTTQLMMVSSFIGYHQTMELYDLAREEGYRFGTYGDAMLIL